MFEDDVVDSSSEIDATKAKLSDADVGFEIDFDDAGHAIACAVAPAIKAALEVSCRVLAKEDRIGVEVVALLDEVARGRSTVWLKLNTSEAKAGHRAFPPEAALLKYVTQGLRAIGSWLGGPADQLASLQQAIRVIAWGASASSHGHPPLPTSAELLQAIIAWEAVKEELTAATRACLILYRGAVEFDPRKRIASAAMLLSEKTILNRAAEMIFIVEEPDYQGAGEWRLRFASSQFTAKSQPGTILDSFYRRELDVRPGDGLHCKVLVETGYGPDFEVLSENMRISEVPRVLPAPRPDLAGSPGDDQLPAGHDTAEEPFVIAR